jgi:hypothetical protein
MLHFPMSITFYNSFLDNLVKFIKQKDGVVYAFCINHPVKNSSNFRHPYIGGKFCKFYFSLVAKRFLIVLTNSLETPK